MAASGAHPACVCVCVRLCACVCVGPQAFPGVPQQYGLQVGSSVNVMSGPGGPGPGGAGPNHPGQGPYPGQSMQYHGGENTYLAYSIKAYSIKAYSIKPHYARCQYGYFSDCVSMLCFLE